MTQEKIYVNKLKPGMTVAKIVENQYGACLITPGMILDEHLIQRLKSFGIKYVHVISESEEKIEKRAKKFRYQYEKNIAEIKGLFQSIKHGNKLKYDQIKGLVDATMEVDTNRDIVYLLSQVRHVDEYTYSHSVNVGLLAMMFGRWLNLPEKEVRYLLYAGLLHDMGKAKIPQEIIQKKGKLSREEFAIMQKHPIYSYQMLKESGFIPEKVARGILFHHERNDGSGYPMGLKQDQIPFISKVLAIVDTYDAITSDRVYKRHLPPFEAFKVFEQALRAYDVALSRLFIEGISKFYLGEKVELTNGLIAEIVHINSHHLSEPIVRLGDEFIDLSKSELKVKDVHLG